MAQRVPAIADLQSQSQPTWVRATQIPDVVPICRDKVAALIASGELPSSKVGRARLVKYSDLVDLIERGAA